MQVEEEYDVTLHVYDLSNGLAKQLSKALVGREFEGIWHTGVVLFGKEFYWAGELQCSTAGRTQYGHPVKVIPLGKTYVPKELIYEYIESVRPEYNTNTYSLFNKNCNNFSNEFSTFLTGHGIPEDIINLPQEALSTPLGAALRPFIESMEQKARQGNQSTIFYPPNYRVAPQQQAAPATTPYVAPTVPQTQQNPVPVVEVKKKEVKLKERTSGYIKKDATAMVSAQGNVKAFIDKIRKANRITPEIGDTLETLVCSSTGTETIPNSVFEYFETALGQWKIGECAILLFIFRKLVMHPKFAEHYLSAPNGPAVFARLLARFMEAPALEQKAVVALGLAAASNVFATEKGAELMLRPDVWKAVFLPALDKAVAKDVSVRSMALGVAYNYARYGLPKEAGEKCVKCLTEAVTESFDAETGSEDAEFRALLGMGYLLYNNPMLYEPLRENYDLIAVVVSYQTSENAKIAGVAEELSAIMDEINEKL